jgi:glucose-1-phosphate adenylyltransferase
MPSTTIKRDVERLQQLQETSEATSRETKASSFACIILGGGQGTRLMPLTQNRCKPALSFGGRYRLIDVPISNSLNAGITKIFVLTQFLARSLHQHIFRTYRQDHLSSGFIEVLSAEQRPGKMDWFQGTADAVRQNAEYLMETPSEFFLILSGDQLYRLDFDKLLQCTEQKEVDVWVATLAVDAKDASRMGIMKVNEDNHIIDFHEKPSTSTALERLKTPQSVLQKMRLGGSKDKEFLGSMGIYLFRRSALFSLLQEDPRDDFGKHLIPTQVKKGRIAAFIHEGYWEDIGTIESFYNANLALNSDSPPFSCHEEKNPIFAAPNHLPGPRIKNANIQSSTICEGVIIDSATIVNSVIGQRTVIRKGCHIQDTYIIGNDFYTRPSTDDETTNSLEIGEDTLIKRAIIDKNVRIGKRVLLINQENMRTYDSPNFYVRDGIIVVPANSTIPDDFCF